jgi:hypothetical protein
MATIPLEENILFPSKIRADTDFLSKFIKMPWVQINLLSLLLENFLSLKYRVQRIDELLEIFFNFTFSLHK